MDREKGLVGATLLQLQIDGLVEAVNEDEVLEVLSGLRLLEGEQLNFAHSSTGFSPLQSAVFEQHHLRKLIVHLLLTKGASYKIGEHNSMELARQCGNEEIFELLSEWDRGKRGGKLAKLARHLITLTDEEAAAWKEQTIAEEQQREDQLVNRDHIWTSAFEPNITTKLDDWNPPNELQPIRTTAPTPNDDLASLPPVFVNHELRSTYYTQLPPIYILNHLSGRPTTYTFVIRIDPISPEITRAEIAAYVCSVIPPSSIAHLSVGERSRDKKFALIYFKTLTEVSQTLTSFTFSALRGTTVTAVEALPVLYVGGWGHGAGEQDMYGFLAEQGCPPGRVFQPPGKSFCFVHFATIAEAEAALKMVNGATFWARRILNARWRETGVQSSFQTTIRPPNFQMLEKADLATFTSRVSRLGWRSAIQQYTTGTHAPLPALSSEIQLNSFTTPSPSIPPAPSALPTSCAEVSKLAPPSSSDDSAPVPPLPTPSFTLFLGLLRSGSDFLLLSLCQGLLGRAPLSAQVEPSESNEAATVLKVEVESRDERKKLVQQLAELEIGGKRLVAGFTREALNQGLKLASEGSSSPASAIEMQYPTPLTSRAGSSESPIFIRQDPRLRTRQHSASSPPLG
ncbi:hypothetical protein BCR35DRAFT_332375 [Leucosporidium creatinivorum]|uniref:RRM domain-containing protein n=1 Tax=Leucosporidium creatinivorum TaxID=106004 RepID=A0A1Y2F293_9BASI|nr:hypothetical protein BCR35DRAFT_332375 [Leucosporidium creatinivorum]